MSSFDSLGARPAPLDAVPLDPVQRRRAAAWLLVLACALFLVTFEQGAVSAGAPLLHELTHDARHLLGFPCH